MKLVFDASYQDRNGFDPAFLCPATGDCHVFLPTLGKGLASTAVALIGNPSRSVLDYHHFSLVMHRHRHFAIYSAANVDFGGRFELKRPKDVWRTDPRIDSAAQVSANFYRANQFDRGHLARREDLEFGPDAKAALAAAADTCHWTNCTPQHARFNESAQLWQGLERHILERAVSAEHFRAQVITGPVFSADDPVLPGFESTPYPLRYWKVVAAISASGKLFATAYLLDQRGVINQFGVRGAPEVPFTPYKTFQTSIEEVEKLTDLSFTGGSIGKPESLRRFDPLAKRVARQITHEGTSEESLRELNSLDDVVLPD